MTERRDPLPRSPIPALGRSLNRTERERFHKYLDLLVKWNKTHRLIGSGDPEWIVENLFLDSLDFLQALPGEARFIADVGSGAGIPGLPIAIARRDLELTLIEGRQRRVSFLSTAVREIGLRNVSVVGARAESLVPTHAGRFDAIVMRCAGSATAMVPRVCPLLRPGGVVLVSSGPRTEAAGEPVWVRGARGTVRSFRRYQKGELLT